MEVDEKIAQEFPQVNANVSSSKCSTCDEECEVNENSSDSLNTLRQEILNCVAKSTAILKSEQIGEPELAWQKRQEIVSKLLDKNPGQFLARFGHYIPKDLLKYFECFKVKNYEVTFYLEQLQKVLEKDLSKTLIKNRRYVALKKLVDEGSYFSENEMRRRNPLLYEHLIGQYLSEDEKNDINRLDISNITLLGFLLEHMDRDETCSFRLKQQAQEEEEEMESDSDDEEIQHSKTPSEEEINLLKQEFVSHMYRSFLEGKDTEFDYTMVDQNTEYDSIEAQQRDAEDSYFDSETPGEAATLSTTDSPKEPVQQNLDEEDELDAYMQTLPAVPQQIH